LDRTIEVSFVSRPRALDRSTALGTSPYTLNHRIIVGLKLEGRPPLRLASDHYTSGEPRVDTYRLPVDFATRLEFFVRRHYVEGLRGYDCFSFMQFVAGFTRTTHNVEGKTATNSVKPKPVKLRSIQPWMPYVMTRGHHNPRGRAGDMLHAVVGFTKSISLSVLGVDQPLTWAPTAELMKLYDADQLWEVTRVKIVDDK
jgi:hypothetical protein